MRSSFSGCRSRHRHRRLLAGACRHNKNNKVRAPGGVRLVAGARLRKVDRAEWCGVGVDAVFLYRAVVNL